MCSCTGTADSRVITHMLYMGLMLAEDKVWIALSNVQCNPMHVYKEVNHIEFNKVLSTSDKCVLVFRLIINQGKGSFRTCI